jgi:hypothetical protein
MAYRTAQYAPDQGVGMIEVRSVAGATSDLFNTIDKGNAGAREPAVYDWISSHEVAPPPLAPTR